MGLILPPSGFFMARNMKHVPELPDGIRDAVESISAKKAPK